MGDILLLALMSGGDYSNGVPNCGVSIVKALVQCGYGKRLLLILTYLRDAELEQALQGWLDHMKQELLTNSKGFLSSSKPELANGLTLDFVNPTIRALYTDPATSWSSHGPPDDSLWIAQEPDLLDIIQLCMRHFGWDTPEDLGGHFRNTLLEGLFIRALSSVFYECHSISRLEF